METHNDPTQPRCHAVSRPLSGVLLLILSFFLSTLPAVAHEPIFGLGPHVIYQGGFGIELEFERSVFSRPQGEESEWGFHTEIMYGVTEDFALTLEIPALVGTQETFAGTSLRSTGFGDLSIRAKYRFWRKDRPGIQDSAAMLVGVKFPTAPTDTEPAIGTGSVDFLTGLAVARESRTYYAFADVRLRLNTTGVNDRRAGRVLMADLAVGYRPWRLEYHQPDLVFLLEFSWLDVASTKIGDLTVEESGGRQGYLGPAIFFTIRNLALKAGIQFPVLSRWNAPGRSADPRLAFSVEGHF